MTIVMDWHDWLALFLQYMMLSLLSISGAISRKRHAGTCMLASCSRMRASKPDAGARPLALACMPMVPPV